MEDETEQTSLILDSKTTLGFKENIASEIVIMPLFTSVSTSRLLITCSQHIVALLQKVLIINIINALFTPQLTNG